MFAHIFEDWHFWQGNAAFLASDETTKKLRSFDTCDACVTWLWMNNHKDAARDLAKAWRAHNAKGF